jgi:hypothetical protein
MTDRAYVRGSDFGSHPLAVLISHEGADLDELAKKFHAAPQDRRPLLLHPYLPGRPALDWTLHRLPRPLPILPLLIRTGQYVHTPGGPDPGAPSLLAALVRALGKA